MAEGNAADTTVVITCFNYGQYLAEAISSVRAQPGPPAEIIVVDDGSTDPETHSAVDAVPEGVRVIRQENQGLATARNNGFAAGSGSFLLPLDADDRLADGALPTLRAALDADPAAAFSYGYAHIFGDWDTVLRTPPYDPYKLLYRHMIGATCLMRRELWEDVGGYDPDFRGYEDWEFWLHALEHGWRGVNVERITLEYRRHGQTMLSEARRRYRPWYRRLREKHAALYVRSGELARETGAGPVEQAIYRWFWGARPIPASVERTMYHILFRERSS